MCIDELLEDILEKSSNKSVANIAFDSEFGWNISSVEYSMFRMGDRYIIICLLPEQDFNELSICMCKNFTEINNFLNDEKDNYNQMEGTNFKIDKEISVIMKSLTDKSDVIIEIMDNYFNSLIEENVTINLKQLIKPSEIIKQLLNDKGLRPKKPKGFLIDETDMVYIRDGSIWFSPIGGNDKYFSVELGITLDCLGIKWVKQKFVLSHDNFNILQNSPTHEEFLHMFNTSKKILKDRRYNSQMSDFLRQKQSIEKKIINLKTNYQDKNDI